MEFIEQDVYNKPRYQYNDQFVTEWLERFKDDSVIAKELQDLEDIGTEVFKLSDNNEWIGTMRHITCENIPVRTVTNEDGSTELKELKEEDYLMIYRK